MNKLPRIKIHAHDARTVSWWRNMRDEIDLDPSYQRKGGIWTDYDRAFLIDSIINGFDMPKLYLADFSIQSNILNVSDKTYAVIDGKQRMQAIFDFYDDLLALNDDIEYKEDPSIDLRGLKFSDLKANHSRLASNFENFNIGVMTVQTSDDSMIRELFDRLNRSKPLTGAEIRNAWASSLVDLIRQLASHSFFQKKIRFSTLRMQDHNSASKLLMKEWDSSKATKKTDIDDFLLSNSLQFEDVSSASDRVSVTLDKMNTIFLDRDPLLTRAGVLTPYYLFLREITGDPFMIRSFLLTFELARKENRQIARMRESANTDLLLYDRALRSADDPSSVEYCSNTLKDYFYFSEQTSGDIGSTDLINFGRTIPEERVNYVSTLFKSTGSLE